MVDKVEKITLKKGVGISGYKQLTNDFTAYVSESGVYRIEVTNDSNGYSIKNYGVVSLCDQIIVLEDGRKYEINENEIKEML